MEEFYINIYKAHHPLSLGVRDDDITYLEKVKREIEEYSKKKKVYTILHDGCIIQTTNPKKIQI